MKQYDTQNMLNVYHDPIAALQAKTNTNGNALNQHFFKQIYTELIRSKESFVQEIMYSSSILVSQIKCFNVQSSQNSNGYAYMRNIDIDCKNQNKIREILLHEFMHEVIDDAFHNNYKPYNTYNEQIMYENAVRDTLLNFAYEWNIYPKNINLKSTFELGRAIEKMHYDLRTSIENKIINSGYKTMYSMTYNRFKYYQYWETPVSQLWLGGLAGLYTTATKYTREKEHKEFIPWILTEGSTNVMQGRCTSLWNKVIVFIFGEEFAECKPVIHPILNYYQDIVSHTIDNDLSTHSKLLTGLEQAPQCYEKGQDGLYYLLNE